MMGPRRLVASLVAGALALAGVLPAPAAPVRRYENPDARAWVEGIFRRLASAAGRPRSAFSITLLDSDPINAFAGPRGDIYATRGLLAAVSSDDELASVLGHEMAHVIRGHLRKLQEHSLKYGLLAMLLGSATRNRTAADLSRALANLETLRFSRKEEREADEVGMDLMVRAGYNPQGAVAMLGKLQEASGSVPAFEFLKSHPDTANRVRLARERLRRYPRGVLERPMPLTYGSTGAEPTASGVPSRAGRSRVSEAPRRAIRESLPAPPDAHEEEGWRPVRLRSGQVIRVKQGGVGR